MCTVHMGVVLAPFFLGLRCLFFFFFSFSSSFGHVLAICFFFFFCFFYYFFWLFLYFSVIFLFFGAHLALACAIFKKKKKIEASIHNFFNNKFVTFLFYLKGT